jgi:hypothetical protein
MHLDGEDTLGRALEDRRAILVDVKQASALAPVLRGDGPQVCRAAYGMGVEGRLETARLPLSQENGCVAQSAPTFVRSLAASHLRASGRDTWNRGCDARAARAAQRQ